MSTSNLNNNSVQRAIRFEHDQFEAVQAVRGDVSFAMWVKRAVQMRLDAGELQSYAPVPQAPSPVAKKQGKAKPRYIWTTPQGDFDSRGKAVEASGIKADSLTKLCDKDEDNGYSRVIVPSLY